MTRRILFVFVLIGLFLGSCTSDQPSVGSADLEGTWDWPMSQELKALVGDDLVAESGYDSDEIVVRMGFDGQDWWQGFVFAGELYQLDGTPEGDIGTFEVDGNELTTDNGIQAVTYRWSMSGDELTLEFVSSCIPPDGAGEQCTTDRDAITEDDPFLILTTEHTYTRSSEDGSY